MLNTLYFFEPQDDFYKKLKMKKNLFLMTLILNVFFFTSCNMTSPGEYFDIAVLNCNSLIGFADDGPRGEFASPSVKAANNSAGFAPMQRKEVIDLKITMLDNNFSKLNSLKQTEDAKEILQYSKALYEFVLPVYKTEYVQLAALYDAGAAKEEIQSLEERIHEKYYPGFSESYNRLISNGKVYAKRHNIDVKWDIKMQP